MISIFNGRKRTLGGETSEVYAQVGVKFREHLHHFKGAKLAVFLSIGLHANENGWAWPSVSLLAKETGYNQGTINDALKELCTLTVNGERVLLKFQPKKKNDGQFHSNHYLLFPSAAEVDEYRDKGIHNTVHNLPSTEKPETVKPPDKEEPAFEEEPTKHVATATPPTSEPTEEPASEELEGESLVAEFFGPKTAKETQPVKHWSEVVTEPWATWGYRSDEFHRQIARFGDSGRIVQELGYKLEEATGLHPVWSNKKKVKWWSSGLWELYEEAGYSIPTAIEAARVLRQSKMTIASPYSLVNQARALATEKNGVGAREFTV